LFELIILVLTVYWLLSFFGQSIVPGGSHTAAFIDTLSVVIVVLIMIRFFSRRCSAQIFIALTVVAIFSQNLTLGVPVIYRSPVQ
jgi:hypothetical protein